ncbi:MAG: hypothetical protein Ct9H90mP17_4570 [Actinomycetota bacterium]|nr:MAG: hypothetical protein Ct9H90mP17_4570 [Actinomycetota bacterium]
MLQLKQARNIPVLNKIDSIDADIENAKKQIFNLIGSKENEIFQISAKTGEGVEICYLTSAFNYPSGEENRWS